MWANQRTDLHTTDQSEAVVTILRVISDTVSEECDMEITGTKA